MNTKKQATQDKIRRLPGYLDDLETQFREAHNPVAPWLALHECVRDNEPPPEWVLHYLDQCAERMCEATDAAGMGKAFKRDADVVAKALGFASGSGKREGWFKRAAQHQQRRTMYDLMVQKYFNEGRLKKEAAKEVGEIVGKSGDTVIRAFEEMLSTLPTS